MVAQYVDLAMKTKYKNIIFDFDGVLVESNTIRAEGYRKLFSGRTERMDNYMEFVSNNPGLSRYKKIRYFYEYILGIKVTDKTVREDASLYSAIVKDRVSQAEAVRGVDNFLQTYKKSYKFALVSASDQDELREICRRRRLETFFIRIFGSPVDKSDNIQRVIMECAWHSTETVYVGDSIHDYEAATNAEIDFIAFGENFPGHKDIRHPYEKRSDSSRSEFPRRRICLSLLSPARSEV